MDAAGLKHWTIGDVRVTRIVEVERITDDIEVLLKGITPAIVQSYPWLFPHMATPEGKIILSFQAFLVETPTHRVMVDTCIGNHESLAFAVFNNLQTNFLADLASTGCPAESIDYVLCTHLHYDHTGWNTRVIGGKRVPTFPNARYIFGKVEWQSTQALVAAGDWHANHVPESVSPIVDGGLADFVETDHQLTPEISLESTPGHTPGHVSVNIRSRGEHAVITGDMMHHAIQCALPDHPDSFDADQGLACTTRRQFLTRHGNGRTLIIGSHFPGPTAGYAIAEDTAWRFAAEPRDEAVFQSRPTKDVEGSRINNTKAEA